MMVTRIINPIFLLAGVVGFLAFRRAAPPQSPDDLTVSYTLTLSSKRGNTGIGETYNGGIETLFAAGAHARLRLASLMRVQSVFIVMDGALVKRVTLLKESGNDRKRTTMTAGEWKEYNKKYAGSTLQITRDTATILRYLCKKVVIALKDGRQLSAWYTPDIQSPAFAALEPAFAGIPGLVLQYEYVYRKKTLRYRATAISHKPIDPAVFTPPGN